MALQIRRGTNTQRLAVTPALGEPILTTDTNKLYVGDGTTVGGINILASSAGAGLTFNATTQQIDFNGVGLTINSDTITEGTANKFYHKTTAQSDVAAMFTALGSALVTGTVTATTAGSPSIVTVSTNTGLVALEPFVITGTGGGGLVPGTYYVVNPAAGVNQITLATTLANAQAGTAITSLTTGAVSSTNFSAGGPDSNIVFTYNSAAQTISANVTLDGVGIMSVSQDTSPSLGGNLSLNGKTINGTGTISYTGTITTSGLATHGGLQLSAGTTISSVSGPLKFTGYQTQYYDVAGTSRSTYGITDGTYYPGENFYVSRNTTASPTVSLVGDPIQARLNFGHDGTSYIGNSGLIFKVDPNATVTTGSVPGWITLGTLSDNNWNNIRGITIDSRGYVGINRGTTQPAATLDINGFARLAVLTAAPASPVNGMVAIADGTTWNPAGTGKSVMVVYLGGGWRVSATAP